MHFILYRRMPNSLQIVQVAACGEVLGIVEEDTDEYLDLSDFMEAVDTNEVCESRQDITCSDCKKSEYYLEGILGQDCLVDIKCGVCSTEWYTFLTAEAALDRLECVKCDNKGASKLHIMLYIKEEYEDD